MMKKDSGNEKQKKENVRTRIRTIIRKLKKKKQRKNEKNSKKKKKKKREEKSKKTKKKKHGKKKIITRSRGIIIIRRVKIRSRRIIK